MDIWVETLASMISSGVSTMQVPPSSSPMGTIFTIGDICRIYSNESGGQVPAEVVGFKNDHILLMPYANMSGISAGNFVRNTAGSGPPGPW